MIEGTVTRKGIYADGEDVCEVYIRKQSSKRIPHKYRKKTPIAISIGDVIYRAGVYETREGVVWISSVLYDKEPRRVKARLVDILRQVNLEEGDRIRLKLNEEGVYLLQGYSG